MKITQALIAHIQTLARLDLSDVEREAMQRDLTRILDYMAELDELDTSTIAPTAHLAESDAPLREDEPRPSLPRELSLASAPAVLDGAFLVPPVIGGEEEIERA